MLICEFLKFSKFDQICALYVVNYRSHQPILCVLETRQRAQLSPSRIDGPQKMGLSSYIGALKCVFCI